MMIEISVAVSFITSYLYNKLPRRRVDMFAEELQKKLADCWSTEQDKGGRLQRCLRVNGRGSFDPLMLLTATDCGLDIHEILQYLPSELVIWIDPKEVSYRFADNDPVQTLYSEKLDAAARDPQTRESPFAGEPHGPLTASTSLNFTPSQAQQPLTAVFSDPFASRSSHSHPAANDSTLFNNHSQNSELDSLQSRLAALAFPPSSVSPHSLTSNSPIAPLPTCSHTQAVTVAASASSSSNNPMQKSPSTPSFTAASFAQTKFGSVKLRTQNRRPPIITAADLARHQRAYSSNSPATNPPCPPALHSSLPANAAAAWLNVQQNAQAFSPNNSLNAHQLASLQQQLALNNIKANAPLNGTPLGGSLVLGLNATNSANNNRSDSSPLHSPALQRLPSVPFDSVNSELARKLAMVSANGLFANANSESTESVDPSQLAAMCNLYQSRFMMNQLLPESAEEQHAALLASQELAQPQDRLRLLDRAAQPNTKLVASDNSNSNGNDPLAAVGTNGSLQRPQLGENKSSKDEYSADTNTSGRSSQHLLLAN